MNSLRLLALSSVLALLATVGSGNIIYVNHAAVGANNGSSWADAFTSLRAGLTAAAPGDEVWVARGTYSPATATPTRSDSFTVSGFAVYGGFVGTETTRDQRSSAANATILTGDIGGGLRAYHVLQVMNALPQMSIVDGVIVVHGQADGPGLDGSGGGARLYANSNTYVAIIDCRFYANEATAGGAIYIGHPSVNIVNCVFAANSAGTGGGVYIDSYAFDAIMNCTFHGNSSPSSGSALYAPTSQVWGDVMHCIIWGNGPNPVSGLSYVTWSCVEGGYQGNLASDPLFVNPPGRDFRLLPGSPCIDAGYTIYLGNLVIPVTTDLAGRPRAIDDPGTVDRFQVFTPQVDLGAFEFLPDCDGNGIVDLDDVSTGTGTDFNHDTVLDECQPAGSYFCFGDGSGAACPCGNSSAPGSAAGCLNATGGAGRLEAFGRAKLGHDSVVFQASGMGANSPALYFQGDGLDLVAGTNGLPFGDGLRCVFGTIVRLATRTSSGGASTFGFGVVGDPTISIRGQVPAAGGTRYYQAWYRSALPYCMPETFNITNAIEIQWVP